MLLTERWFWKDLILFDSVKNSLSLDDVEAWRSYSRLFGWKICCRIVSNWFLIKICLYQWKDKWNETLSKAAYMTKKMVFWDLILQYWQLTPLKPIPNKLRIECQMVTKLLILNNYLSDILFQYELHNNVENTYTNIRHMKEAFDELR